MSEDADKQLSLDEVSSGNTRQKRTDEAINTALDRATLGDIPSEWNSKRLKDITEGSLYGVAESAKGFDPNKLRYIRITDISENGVLKPEDTKSLSKTDVDEKYLLQPGQLLLARSGATVGKSYLYSENDPEATYGGYLIRFIPDTEQVLPEYLFYYTQSDNYDNWVTRVARQGAQKNINAKEYSSILLPIPPHREQRKIATVLYTIDEAIQKTKEIEKQLQRTQTGLVQKFLNQGIEDTETKDTKTKLGTIPSHWDVVTIEKILADGDNAFTDGARYSLSSAEIHSEGEARAILLEEVGKGEFKDTTPKFATQEKYEEITHRAIYPGEVVVAKMAEPVARACIVPDTYNKYLLGCADVVRIVPNDEVDERFLMYCMNSHKVWCQAVAHLRGTGRSRINLENIAELKIPKPPVSEQERITEIFHDYDQRIENERAYRDQLQRLKQGLMQDLLSGEVRTTDADIDILDEIRQHG